MPALRRRIFGKKPNMAVAKGRNPAGAKGPKTVGVKGSTAVPLPDQSQYLPIHEPRKMAAHTGRIRSYIMGKVMDEKANRGMKLIYNTDTLSLFFNVCLCMRDHM